MGSEPGGPVSGFPWSRTTEGPWVLPDPILSEPGPKRREVELLIAADHGDAARDVAVTLCAKAFQSTPVPGVVTFISRGTDDDAHGVLSGFGLTGDIERTAGDEGFDIVYVTLREQDLERIPESRIHTALEASLNCEVHIRTR
ncbi:hypothetical protein O978_16895 [Mycobacterium avium subsp. paratuberculosis 10-5864]|nr:hypothetical protein O978_16895 [Mycobacterium avium subsp. paratuberculosis 10-5864]